MQCTRCDTTGFLNLHQVDSVPLDELAEATKHESIKSLIWYWQQVGANDVQVCDCCGDGENWHGTPGQHFEGEAPETYDYNGGRPECY